MKPTKIYTEVLEEEALKQFQDAMALDCVVAGALMPDAHTGYSLPIGAVVAVKDYISPAFVGYDIGCLDADTEFMTTNGWKRIADYQEGDILLQYDPYSDYASFTQPINYIKNSSSKLTHITNSNGVDMMLSDNHKILMWHGTPKRGYSPHDYTLEELLYKHNTLAKGNSATVKTTFSLYKPNGISLSDNQIRLYVMCSADGCLRGNSRVEFHFRKERKVSRAIMLLESCSIPYRITVGKDSSTYIYFSYDGITKDLTMFWGCSKQQFEVLVDEILHWDGHDGEHKTFSTKIKDHADVVQYALAAIGIRANIHKINYPDKPNWSSTYSLYFTKNEYVGIPKNSSVVEVTPVDGYEYCFTVPTGYFIARRNGYIFTTGNCGMSATKLNMKASELDKDEIFKLIYKHIPVGREQHKTAQVVPYAEETSMIVKDHLERKGKYQMGTLGGGNHFIELGEGHDGHLWIVIHSGSRNIGHAVAEHYMELCARNSVNFAEVDLEFEGRNLAFKQHNPEGYQKALEANRKKVKVDLEGQHLFPIESWVAQAYIKDLKYCLEYALENRKAMSHKIIELLGNPEQLEFINRNHNHAELKDSLWIHRKGATHAEEGMLGVIPGNMRDGSFIVRGKGNPDSLYSSSHGAGRVLSRKKAQTTLSMQEFSDEMCDVVAKVDGSTLDESPMAYKNIFEVMELQKDLVDIIDHIKPLVNIKG